MKMFLVIFALGSFFLYDSYKDIMRQTLLANTPCGPRPPNVPTRAPSPSQEDIDLAMKLFAIRTHKYVVGPTFDKTLVDRGLTHGTLDSPIRTVKIGPAAFTSWGMLASTLAHEIEVHAQQSFAHIRLQDMATSSELGTISAEREAYNYELKCKDRFGLSKTEAWLIEQTVEQYYGTAQ